MKLTWALLLFGLLCPVEILGQYASPYLNPLRGQKNPSAIVWREQSIVGVNIDSSISEKNSPMTQRDTSNSQKFVLAHMGDFFGIKSGFEFYIGDHKSTTEFVASDKTSGYTGQDFDKTGGFAIGPLAIGYNDVADMKIALTTIEKTSYSLIEQNITNITKINRKGLSLKIANLFIGIHQKASEYKETKADMKVTRLADSYVYNFSLIQTPHVVNENTVGIGILLGKENEIRYRLEIYDTQQPEVQFSQTLTNHDGSVSTSIGTTNEEKTHGVVLETQINNYYFTLEYKKSESSDAGTSSGKAYSNTTGQEITGLLGFPLGESFQFNISLAQGLTIQPYTASPDEYESYEVEKKYELTLGYLY